MTRPLDQRAASWSEREAELISRGIDPKTARRLAHS
jgi:hypothetical protein